MGLAAPPLSKARRAALQEYVSTVRRELYLQHWEIRLPDEYPNDDDAIAEIDPCDGRYVATVRFGDDFWSESRERARAIIVHELLHLQHVRLTNMIRLGQYRQQLGAGLYEHLEAELKREAEYMVDALTTVVAPSVPLPKRWPA
jgi:hypothetical protein